MIEERLTYEEYYSSLYVEEPTTVGISYRCHENECNFPMGTSTPIQNIVTQFYSNILVHMIQRETQKFGH